MNKLGLSFAERIISADKFHLRKKELKVERLHSRLPFFRLLFYLSFIIIMIQLVYLTLLKGNYYQSLSSQNRIKENIYPAPRGVITDRKGEILVNNKPGFVALVNCGKNKCYRTISHEQALQMEAKGDNSPLNMTIARDYLEGDAFSHLIGITGQVQEEEINQNYCDRVLGYEDVLGRSGVEQAFDCQLQGSFGKELIEIDAYNKPLKTLSEIKATVGQSLTLSIDKELQLIAKKELEGKKGAVIAQIPQTGEILILYSSPSFNLHQLNNISEEEYLKLINNPDQSLFNRAIAGLYPPGSVFKPIVAAAALEEKVIDEKTEFEDTGEIKVGLFSYTNWYFTQYGKTEGLINIVTALKRSTDTFFYHLGELLGEEKIAFWANKFMFGKKLGIEISKEEEGLVPTKKWKQEAKKEQWFLGDTYHLSIGQGNLLVTPLQVSVAISAFANNGVICRPTVLKTNGCEKLTDKLISNKTLNIVKKGMVEVCKERGTAYPFFDFQVGGQKMEVACKTGTAEFGDENDKTHAWFVAFAPADKPQILVTVLVEEGGEGSDVAAPIAKKIFEEWFKM